MTRLFRKIMQFFFVDFDYLDVGQMPKEDNKQTCCKKGSNDCIRISIAFAIHPEILPEPARHWDHTRGRKIKHN